MLVRKIIDAGPSPVFSNGTANFSRTLPNETPSCLSNPIWPSKIGPGPVMPARARSAEKTPWRAAFAKATPLDRKSTRLNSSHSQISYAVFCLKKKNKEHGPRTLNVTQDNDHAHEIASARL